MDTNTDDGHLSVQLEHDPETGQLVKERWRNQYGHLDRHGDEPAFIDYCPEHSIPIERQWHDGSGTGPHRLGDKPAKIITHATTGVDTVEAYMIGGQLHRIGDNPAVAMRTEEGKLTKESYWHYGKLHRDPRKGPAEITYDADGKVSGQRFWVVGALLGCGAGTQPPTP